MKSRGKIELIQGDITTLQVDAIVNAANRFLAHDGGVALAISRKGGPKIQSESAALILQRGPLETGQAVLTGAGKLPAKYVIHTVGPVWKEHTPEQADRLLRKAIRNVLLAADANDLHSIAFPAISTGIYGFPLERAAQQMIDEATGYLVGKTNLERVIFCLFDEKSYRAFESLL